MATKEEILNNMSRHIRTEYDMPEIDIKGIVYTDPVKQFMDVSTAVGGGAVELKEGEDINNLIRSLYPDAKTIASNMKEITIATISPDDTDDPHTLNGTDVAVVEGEIGVAENGCVWIPQNVKEKVIYFIADYLVIVLDKNKVVNNMHEAYDRMTFSDKGFGVFISGPSKTADIEQALVVGAHGARGVVVVLR